MLHSNCYYINQFPFPKSFHFKYWMSSLLLFKKDVYFNFIFNLWTFNNKSLNECFKFLFCLCEFYSIFIYKRNFVGVSFIFIKISVFLDSCFASADLDLINKQICTLYSVMYTDTLVLSTHALKNTLITFGEQTILLTFTANFLQLISDGVWTRGTTVQQISENRNKIITFNTIHFFFLKHVINSRVYRTHKERYH